jgi:glutamate synthase domain-containing protein 3
MTAGIVLVLGRAGRNFAAGMSNGVAYVIDEAGTFPSRLNGDMVELGQLDGEDIEVVRKLIREHEEKTVSARARNILVRWEEYLPLFRKVVPRGAPAARLAATRQAYLTATPGPEEPVLTQRSA